MLWLAKYDVLYYCAVSDSNESEQKKYNQMTRLHAKRHSNVYPSLIKYDRVNPWKRFQTLHNVILLLKAEVKKACNWFANAALLWHCIGIAKD